VEWQDSGDEAWLIAKRLPQAHVLVCEDRVRGAEILQESGVQEIICDDGFQHFRLQPSRSLVLLPEDMSAKDLHSLPFGTLREDLSAIQHAGEVWIPAASFVFWSEILDRRGINVPRYVFRREITTFTVGTRVLSKEECAARLGNEEVHVVTALARPQHFTRALGELLPRARIYKHQFGDHQAIALERLTSLRGVIVMTEKDAVKTVWSPEFEFLSERVYVAREEVRA
jgi:tetraacyldisaccharide 4'-kinase